VLSRWLASCYVATMAVVVGGCSQSRDAAEQCDGLRIERAGARDVRLSFQAFEKQRVYQIGLQRDGSLSSIWLVHDSVPARLSTVIVGKAPKGFMTVVPLKVVATSGKMSVVIGTGKRRWQARLNVL